MDRTNIGNLFTANGSGFSPGSTFGIDTTFAGTNGFSYGAISGNIGLTVVGTNSLILTGSSSYAGPTTISGGTLQFGDGTNTGWLSSTAGIIDNASLAFNNTGPQTYSGIISGLGNLTKSNTNTLTLVGANSFSGTTVVNGGVLQLGNPLALQQSAEHQRRGSLSFGATAASFGGLSGSGTLALANTASAAVVLTIGGNNGNTIYSGAPRVRAAR